MKTPEEIKAGLRCHAAQWHAGECPDHEPGCKGCPYDNDYHDPDELMADALELIETLEDKKQDWIDGIETPPEKNQRVIIVSTSHQKIGIGNYHGKGKCGGLYYMVGNHLETARWWMPLPKLPEEEA